MPFDVGVEEALEQIGADIAALRDADLQALNAQTGTTYTLVLSDAGKFLTFSNTNPVALTVPTNASVAFPFGSHTTTIEIFNRGAGAITIGGAGVTFEATPGLIIPQYHGAVLKKILTNTWVVVGGLSA